jgi:hypothetical protein
MADVFFPGLSYDVAVGASSVQSTNTVSPGVTVVRLLANANCYVQMGFNPTATKPGSVRLSSSIGEYFRVVPGMKFAAIEDTAAAS